MRSKAFPLPPRSWTSAVLGAAATFVACATPPPPPSAERAEEVSAPGAHTPGATPTANPSAEAFAELEALDPRRPVPLQPMMAWHQKQQMQDHLVAIQGITEGLAREDWEGIARASAAIETSPQMQQMCEHMGAGAPGFTELALDFHRRADAIGEAARAHDRDAVLRATASTLEACTSCHAAYRQEIVDAQTWMTRTGEVHDPAGMHGMP